MQMLDVQTEFLEMDRPYGNHLIRKALKSHEPIVYSCNGHRCQDGSSFLQTVEKKLELVGISRIADISYLAAHNFPVYQTTRPNVLLHPSLGQNSGSQGKGRTLTQAKLSCIMETVETRCGEPRNASLIRGCFRWLQEHYVIANPRGFFPRYQVNKAKQNEPLMWTPAYHVNLDVEALVPAEAVFLPFVAPEYKTRSIFPNSSNGLASGATYLEATIHGLYEVIERSYLALFEVGQAEVVGLYESDYQGFSLKDFYHDTQDEYELQLFGVKRKDADNLPMVICYLVGEPISFAGQGCAGDIETAIDRAISEAMQSMSTFFSGSREDLGRELRTHRPERFTLEKLPCYRSLTIEDYKNQVQHRCFDTLRQEFEFIIGWLSTLGYSNVFIVNLTRVGIDIPVVRVIVQGLPCSHSGGGIHQDFHYQNNVVKLKFRIV